MEGISNSVHPDLLENPAIFAEKLSLFPEGSFVLATDDTTWGYAFVHPWRLFEIPKLNHLLGRLPAVPDCVLIHDVAVLAPARGHGASLSLLKLVTNLAKERSLPCLALVSVYDSHLHWALHGFEVITNDTVVDKLKSYGETAHTWFADWTDGSPRPVVILDWRFGYGAGINASLVICRGTKKSGQRPGTQVGFLSASGLIRWRKATGRSALLNRLI